MNRKESFIFKVCKKYCLTAIFYIFLFFVLTAVCTSAPISNNFVNSKNSEEEITFVAEVRWMPLEGGFYGLVAEDGRRFLPLNLPEGFRKDGLKTRVRGIIKEDIATIYMWGTPLEILEIEIFGRTIDKRIDSTPNRGGKSKLG